MSRMVSTLVLALILSMVTLASAGGEKCAKEAKEHSAHAAHDAVAEKAKHGWLGLDLDKSASGYVVTGVSADSPAAEAGFQKGDVLVAFNGIALADANKDALKKAKAGLTVGSRVTYTVSRAGAQRQVTAKLAEVPPQVLAQWEKEYDRPVAVAQTDN
jgi:S1-C subfamily serine protease